MTKEEINLGEAQIGDRITNSYHTIWDTGPAIPKVVMKGVSSWEKVQEITKNYLKYNRGKLVVVTHTNEIKVTRIIEPLTANYE